MKTSVKWTSTASTVDQDVDRSKTSVWSTSTSWKRQDGRPRPDNKHYKKRLVNNMIISQILKVCKRSDSLFLTSVEYPVNKINLQALTLVGPTRKTPILMLFVLLYFETRQVYTLHYTWTTIYVTGCHWKTCFCVMTNKGHKNYKKLPNQNYSAI